MPKRNPVDPKATGVKAREIPNWPEPADGQARFFGQPGDMIRTFRHNAQNLTHGFLVACPGCGQFGSIAIFPMEGPHWNIVSGLTSVGGVTLDAGPGDINDVTTLSLSPSILKHCCGWHGYLRHGVFESC